MTATMGRSVLILLIILIKDERMKERIHAVFTTNISIALLFLLILLILIVVTYFHEMRSEGERMKDPVFTTNISFAHSLIFL